MRYDQFMRFGWKFLIPVSILWIIVVSIARYVANQRDLSLTALVVIFAICLGVFIAVASWVNGRRKVEPPVAPKVIDPFAGGYPVPPLPGQRLAGERTPVTVSQSAAPQPAVGETSAMDREGADDA
jgi:NADH-quinone oxidoreductase subunit H